MAYPVPSQTRTPPHPRYGLIESLHRALIHPQVAAGEKAVYGKLLAAALAEQAKAAQQQAGSGFSTPTGASGLGHPTGYSAGQGIVTPVGPLSGLGHPGGFHDTIVGPITPGGAAVDTGAAAPAPTWLNGHSSIEEPTGPNPLFAAALTALGARTPSITRGAVL